MKKFWRIWLNILANLLIIGGLVYVFRGPLINVWRQWQGEYFPCSRPIAYSIGEFDDRFGVSQADFLAAIVQAEQIWEEPVAKELFAHEPDGWLKINLIYDIRQEATLNLQKLGLSVKDDQASYDAVKKKYDALKTEYAKIKAELDALVATFKSRKEKYEAEVKHWNKRGGAREQDYQQLEADRLALNKDIDAINQKQDELNAVVDNINSLVVVLNRLAASLNITAEKYNQIGQQLPDEFEEGSYQSDAGGQRINIYQFDNKAKLVRVLAHELGHALGLEHLEDTKAIMYRLNNGINEKPTEADLTALKNHCGVK